MKKFIKQIGKTFLFTISCGLLSVGIYGQNTGNNTLTFPPFYLDQVNGQMFTIPQGPNQTPLYDYTGYDSENTHAAMQDENGDLLFYIVDGTIYDHEGYFIETIKGFAFSTTYWAKGVSETLIVPDPNNCLRYYIFAAARSYNNESMPFFTILDMGLDNPYNPGRKGAIDHNALTAYNYNYSETAVCLAGNSDFPNFLTDAGGTLPKDLNNLYFASPKNQICSDKQFVYISSEISVLKFTIDDLNGLSYTGNHYHFPVEPHIGQGKMRGEMEVIELSNGNYRLAAPYWLGSFYDPTLQDGIGIYTCDLDINGDLIQSTVEVVPLYGEDNNEEPAFVHGLEFSASGRYLYITHETKSFQPNPIEYFDFNNPQNGLQNLSVPNASDFQLSQLETTKDGELLMVTSDRMAVLDNPDSPTTSSFTDPFVLFTSSQTYYTNLSGPSSNIGGRESYVLPKQIKQKNYSAHLTSDPSCSNIYDGSLSVWTPGNNPFGSVNGDVYIDGNLVFSAGMDIEIQDMTFYFTPGSKVIIEEGSSSQNGGTLVMNNTTFTVDDTCNTTAMWNGVQVLGDPNLDQGSIMNSPQGVLRMYNNSKIEHAYIGAITGSYTSASTYPFKPQSIDYSKSGGIIYASSSKFLNNETDVRLLTYTPPNGHPDRSNFSYVEFATTAALNDPTIHPEYHAHITGRNRTNFSGCSFRNDVPNVYNFDEQGIGLVVVNSKVNVRAKCSTGFLPCNENDFIRTEFKNLHYGVAGISFFGSSLLSIDRSDFINNYFGTYLIGLNNPEITLSNYEVYRSSAPNQTFETYGVTLQGCDGYIVEENSFEEYNDPITSNNGNTYGVVVISSGETNNEIYKNTFRELKVGVQAQGTNGEFYSAGSPNPGNKGLKILCNEFLANIYEANIGVTHSYGSNNDGRIDYHQGYCSAVNSTRAGNKFSHNTFTSENDIKRNPDVLAFQYAHHSDLITTPISYSSLVYPTDCNGMSFTSNSCPSNITSGGVIVVLPYLLAVDSLNTIIKDLNQNIDAGNTDSLLAIVNDYNAENAYDALMDTSFVLSESVMLAFLAKENLSESQIKDVILANAPVSLNVIDVLEEMNLSSSTMQEIYNNQVGESPLVPLNNEISYNEQLRDRNLSTVIRGYYEDTTILNPMDSIVNLLNGYDEKDKKRYLIGLYVDNDEFTPAETLLTEYGQTFGEDDFFDWATLFVQEGGAQNVLNIVENDPSSAVASKVTDLSTSTDQQVAQQASILLNYAGRFRLNAQIVPLQYGKSGQSFFTEEDESNTTTESFFSLYPNPTDGTSVHILLTDDSLENVSVKITDLTGKSMLTSRMDKNKKELVIDQLSSGVYIVYLLDNDLPVEQKRLIITK